MLAPTNPKVHRNQHTQTNAAVEPRSRWRMKRKPLFAGFRRAELKRWLAKIASERHRTITRRKLEAFGAC